MATTSYTIYSHYDPADRERLEIETGQQPTTSEEESWALEATAAFPRRMPPPPRFVPASRTYEFASEQASTSVFGSADEKPRSDIADWYRSLTLTTASDSQPDAQAIAETSSQLNQTTATTFEKPNKNNWFILNALKSTESPSLVQSSSTLADLLERDPPPRPSEARFKPPVWLGIGPSNKGFAMLERSGWSEGEPLGKDFIRRSPLKGKGKAREIESRQMVSVRVGEDDDDEIWELKQVSTIDLTESDSDSNEELLDIRPAPEDNSPYARKALITPIATVLKSDRLGIGLKAKTTGPYRESVKRITHSAAALAAHSKASEDLKRWKQTHGRGRRGYAKRQKQDEEHRQAMLAYMNS